MVSDPGNSLPEASADKVMRRQMRDKAQYATATGRSR